MSEPSINKGNVGRIAERIVANELEYHGFKVSDLNKEGTAANADLLAAKDGKTWQIQVKGSTKAPSGWWVNYGYCDQSMIDGESKMFNRVSGFYIAQIVVQVCVESPREYRCVVLPVDKAEKAAQLNLDHSFRNRKKDGSPKKPGKVWGDLDVNSKPRDTLRKPFIDAERKILSAYIDKWNFDDDPALV